MIDSEFERKGRAMSEKLNQTIYLQYTWPQEPQTMTHSDEVAQLRARIAELESERATLRLSLNTTNVIVNDQIGKIADLIKERDAAIADARTISSYADYARRMTGVFYTRDENDLITKYLQQQ